MQTTIEVRWFLRGIPPAAVEHWFEFECPGKLLTAEAETREDLYAYLERHHLDRFREFAHLTNREEINLKLREGNLELKLRQQQLGIQTFTGEPSRPIWQGKVEQWSKFGQQQLKNFALFNSDTDISWISVAKKRSQKIDRGVTSELTRLQTKGNAWWSIAFEMTQEYSSVGDESWFREAVARAAKTYRGPELLAENSCGYVRWLLDIGEETDYLG